jgi:hypothetical protein
MALLHTFVPEHFSYSRPVRIVRPGGQSLKIKNTTNRLQKEGLQATEY